MIHGKKKSQEKSNLKLAVIFIGIVLFFVAFSILLKAFFLVKDSKFDSTHSFNIALKAKEEDVFISFSPADKSVSILKTDGSWGQKDLEIPIDGVVKMEKSKDVEKHLTSLLFKKGFSFNSESTLTIIDLIRLSIFTKTVPSNSLFVRNITKDDSQQRRESILSLSFSDPTIKVEKKSIEVVNSTDVFGLGSRLATLISHIGGNVILVGSQEKEENSKIIYTGEKASYTVKRLSKILGFPTVRSDKEGIADIIIIIGKDRLNELKF